MDLLNEITKYIADNDATWVLDGSGKNIFVRVFKDSPDLALVATLQPLEISHAAYGRSNLILTCRGRNPSDVRAAIRPTMILLKGLQTTMDEAKILWANLMSGPIDIGMDIQKRVYYEAIIQLHLAYADMR